MTTRVNATCFTDSCPCRLALLASYRPCQHCLLHKTVRQLGLRLCLPLRQTAQLARDNNARRLRVGQRSAPAHIPCVRCSPVHCILTSVGQAMARSQACTEVQETVSHGQRHVLVIMHKGFPCPEACAEAPQGLQLRLFAQQVQAHGLQEAWLWNALLADPEPATLREEALLPGRRQLRCISPSHTPAT